MLFRSERVPICDFYVPLLEDHINGIRRDNPPPFAITPLVSAQFRREAAKFFGLLKIINILAKFLGFFPSRDKPPPCFGASGNKGGVIATNTIDMA